MDTNHLTQRSWLVLRLVCGRERKACADLVRLGLFPYLPQAVRPRRPATALFPGYCFLPATDRLSEVCDRPLVLGPLRIGEQLAWLSDNAIAEVRVAEREFAEHARLPQFRPGQRVRTIPGAGLWADLPGIVERLDTQDRVVISMLLPGRSVTRLSLPAQWLSASL